MTEAQEYQLSVYLAFEKNIILNQNLFDRDPNIRPHFDIFCQQIQIILKTKHMIEESEKIINQYIQLRNELAKNIILFSRKIIAFAMLEELTDLQGLFCYSGEELLNANDDKLLDTSKLILRKTKEYVADIVEYGINDYSITNFQNIIDQFMSLRMDKKSSDQIADEAKKHISSLLLNTEILFNNKLAPLAETSVNS